MTSLRSVPLQSLFGFQLPTPYLYAAALAIIFVLLAIFAIVLRKVVGGGLNSDASGARNRQPRLGVVDTFTLDRQRQLIIVRRDNVEHLLMIGGAADIVIESNIVRSLGLAPQREPQSLPIKAPTSSFAPAHPQMAIQVVSAPPPAEASPAVSPEGSIQHPLMAVRPQTLSVEEAKLRPNARIEPVVASSFNPPSQPEQEHEPAASSSDTPSHFLTLPPQRNMARNANLAAIARRLETSAGRQSVSHPAEPASETTLAPKAEDEVSSFGPQTSGHVPSEAPISRSVHPDLSLIRPNEPGRVVAETAPVLAEIAADSGLVTANPEPNLPDFTLTANESDHPSHERSVPRTTTSLDENLRRLLGRRPESYNK